jgi:hypothetical protein
LVAALAKKSSQLPAMTSWPKPDQPIPHISQSLTVSMTLEKRHFFLGVHGIFHQNADGSNRQTIIRQCLPGEELDLVPEPDNPYDADAIKVCRKNGDQLGYLPAEHAFRMKVVDEYRVTVADITELEDRPGQFACGLRVAVLA